MRLTDARERLVLGITLSRVPTSVAIAAICSSDVGRWQLGVVAILASWNELSDVADGHIARRLGVASRTGAIADSASDFVARTLTFIGLIALGILPPIALAPAVVRDGLLWAGRVGEASDVSNTGPFVRVSGKLSGFVHGTTILILTWTAFAQGADALPVSLESGAAVAIVLTSCLAGVDYGRHLFRNRQDVE